MAHIQSKYSRLWKPQSLSIDKINTQKMFIDNIDEMEAFALNVLKSVNTPVLSITALRAIDTSDTTLYTDGTMIMVKSNGIYFFDRGNIEVDNGNTIIAPTIGGGRWVSDRVFLGSLAFKNTLSPSDVGLGNVPNVTTNDQTPTFTQATSLTNVASGETMSTLFGKVMKAIAELISHIGNKSNPHTVTKTQIGLGNVPNVATNDQAPTFTQAGSLTNIASGETMSTLFGKIMKAITDFISHLSNKSNPHAVTKDQVGLGNVPNVATNSQTPTFTQATSFTNVASGETLSTLFGKVMRAITELISHIGNKSNPHTVTKDQVGLGNVDNTSDINKPISTAVQNALNTKATITEGEIGTVMFSRLTGFRQLASIDLNTIKYTGQYGVMDTCANRPSTHAYGILEVIMYSSHWLIQRYMTIDNYGAITGTWYRSWYSDNTWTQWVRYDMNTMAIATVDEIV